MGEGELVEWEGTTSVSIRMKWALVHALDSIVKRDTHRSRTDVIEQAVREYLEKWFTDNDKITLTNYIEKAKQNSTEPK